MRGRKCGSRAAGWTRVDPTAVVAPERLRRGILDLLPQALSARERLLRASAWLTRLLQRWDAANAWWSDHVVQFDDAAQLDLLARLGVRSPDVRYLGWGFMLALCVWLAIIAWHAGRSERAAPADALARAYARLCRKLARIAPPRAPHQGPMSLAAAVIAQRPDLRDPVHALLSRYAQLRFGAPSPGTRAQRHRGVPPRGRAAAPAARRRGPAARSQRAEADLCVGAVAEGLGSAAPATAQVRRRHPRHHPSGAAHDLEVAAHP